MASYVEYTGDGVTRRFAVPFQYILPAHVRFQVNGQDVLFAFPTPGEVELETAEPTPSTGEYIRIFRQTPRELLVDFTPGVLTEEDLDTAVAQAAFLAEEAADITDAGLFVDPLSGAIDAGGRRIENVADPVNPGDVATRGWANTAAQSTLAGAVTARQGSETARDAAIAARAGSEAARDAAISARDQAVAARDSASGHRLNAQNAQFASETARDASIAARDAAQGFRNEAQTFRNEAGVEKDAAVSARSGAEAARDAALGARDVAVSARDDAQGAAAAAAQSEAILANAGTAILRNITVSEDPPSGTANDGDLWLQVT